MAELFVKSLLTDTVLLQPHELGGNYADVVLARLNEQFAGKCSHHGFIEPRSISIRKIKQAEVSASALNGTVKFAVQYFANVCNPPVGAVVSARVVVRNRMGIQAHSGILYENGDFLVVIRSFVTNMIITKASEVDVSSIKLGDEINVEILSKQFQLRSQMIEVIGRVVISATPSIESALTEVRAAAAAQTPMTAFSVSTLEYDRNSGEDDEFEDDDGEDEDEDEEAKGDPEDIESDEIASVEEFGDADADVESTEGGEDIDGEGLVDEDPEDADADVDMDPMMDERGRYS